MPKFASYLLVWSCSQQAYELYESQGNTAVNQVPESPDWFVWVSQVSSFAFHGQLGSYTARKEGKQHGAGYWYAYARTGEKLTKRYLGKGIDLTLTRLEQVAQELQCCSPAALRHQALPPPPASVQQPGSDSAAQNSQPGSSARGYSPLPTDLLLATKLLVPRRPPQLLHRSCLLQRLQHGLQRALLLVSAPAGFGKSTLLADWLTSCALPAAWLSLEPQDNDPIRFFSYLLAALQTYDPQLGRTAQTLLHPLRPPPLETVLTLLLNDLLGRRAEDQDHLILVLDDYHVITDETIHHALCLLLDHLPPQMHLVLSTREDPPLPLARLRGRDALMELRAADLQFTPEETTSYLVEKMGLPLSAEQRVSLQERTEGWITGLQLAAHSLQDHDDPAAFIAAFSGSHRYVMDYLLEEVLHRQPAAVQDFLLHTCILERLSAPLCDAVRAQDDSQTVLDVLEGANVFLLPLDEERRWYRYHHLFAQVLRHRLQQTAPTLVPDLHLRASHWYEQQEHFAEAIAHALAASALEEAARLIEQSAERCLLGNQMQLLCTWLHALPEPLVLARPVLCLVHAIALIYTNHWEMASARLQAVERELGPGKDTLDAYERVLLGQIAASWSLLARFSGDLEQSVAFAQRALDLLPETEITSLSLLLRLAAVLGAARAYLVSGNVTGASEARFTHTIAFTRTFNSRLTTFRALILLARFQVLQGRLHQAAASYEEAVQVVRPEEWLVFINSPSYYFGLGDLLCEWNELEAAEEHLSQGMDLIRTHVLEADELWLGYAALARLQHARGRDDQAFATLDTFLQLAQKRPLAPVFLAQAAAMRAQLELARDNLPAAVRWAATCSLSVNDPLSYPREREYLTLARVRIAQARRCPTGHGLTEVLVLLGRLLTEAEGNGRMHSVLEILLLRALALKEQGNCTAALATLTHALTLAEPEGYVRLFLDEGPPLLALLRQACRQKQAPGYLATLLAASKPEGSDAHMQTSQPSVLLEPLTTRECEVLQLLLDGTSNQEIAHHLVLSVNTVKKHVLNICGKLNVQSRAQVIVKANALHLLQEPPSSRPIGVK